MVAHGHKRGAIGIKGDAFTPVQFVEEDKSRIVRFRNKLFGAN